MLDKRHTFRIIPDELRCPNREDEDVLPGLS